MDNKRRRPAFIKCKGADVVRRYLDGESAYSIGNSIGIKGNSVVSFLAENGVSIRTHKEAMIASSNVGTRKGAKRPEISKPLWSRRVNSKGYVLIKSPLGWVLEHRLVMEFFINRKLRDNEIVHHEDRDKKNKGTYYNKVNFFRKEQNGKLK